MPNLCIASATFTDAAHAGQDILLIPQPSSSPADPLNWSRSKKYWTLFLISAYACVNSFGENNWGAAWTTIAEETGVTLENMNGGSALNYLLLGFFNVIWIPTAMQLGRKIVYILSLLFVLGSGIWGGFFEGTAQYYAMLAIGGIGTATYQALIQLTVSIESLLIGILLLTDGPQIFDLFFAHERGRMVAIYVFFQQLGSILGLILGGYITDGIGWRRSQPIVAVACGILILLFIFTFDDTMFPRYRFGDRGPLIAKIGTCTTQDDSQVTSEKDQKLEPSTSVAKFALIHYLEDDQTTWYQYFQRPFYLFAFPNIVLAGIQFAFGCTAGIISFNPISEIMTEPPYNWTWHRLILRLDRPLPSPSEQRLQRARDASLGLYPPIHPRRYRLLQLVFTYGWGATAGDHWISIAVGLCCMIAQQVSATSIATAYAMECFDRVGLGLPLQQLPKPTSFPEARQASSDKPESDLRRTRHRPRHLFLLHQLRHFLLRAAFHRRNELRLDAYVLWHLGAFVHAYGWTDVDLGEELETEVEGAL
ncbi:hypothetical protein CNMCM6106_006689 [Aspergillus hiratsukae]|uniref:MFS general substrate transporter n=1 Tax=Aspergillus hiratsukae TaxID=1194566 RepID=A0A8H6V018_9EURO|nr:hypothetical protein CNMCM6106_006689 [Aspergillus hiratsukae]